MNPSAGTDIAARRVMRSVLILFSLLLIAKASFADEKGQTSPDWVDQYVDDKLCNTELTPDQMIPSRYLRYVINAYRVYIAESKAVVAKKLEETRSHLKIRETIPFRGQEFPVLAVLGIGTSGVFYAAQTPEGVRTIEELFNGEVAERIGHFKTRAGVHVLDRENNFVVEEFILGLPEYRIAKGKDWLELGVRSPVFANEIAKWMMSRFTGHDRHDRDDVLIEIPTGRIVQLFPYPGEGRELQHGLPSQNVDEDLEPIGPIPPRPVVF